MPHTSARQLPELYNTCRTEAEKKKWKRNPWECEINTNVKNMPKCSIQGYGPYDSCSAHPVLCTKDAVCAKHHWAIMNGRDRCCISKQYNRRYKYNQQIIEVGRCIGFLAFFGAVSNLWTEPICTSLAASSSATIQLFLMSCHANRRQKTRSEGQPGIEPLAKVKYQRARNAFTSVIAKINENTRISHLWVIQESSIEGSPWRRLLWSSTAWR